MAFERCHAPEELQRLIGSTGARSASAGGGIYNAAGATDVGATSPGGGWAGDAGTTGS